jgi:hypothetical protein
MLTDRCCVVDMVYWTSSGCVYLQSALHNVWLGARVLGGGGQ